MKVNIYQKAYLHHLILPFTYWVTESVKMEMCVYLEILNTFFAGDHIWSCMLFKSFSVSWESVSTEKSIALFDSPFYKLDHPTVKKGMSLYINILITSLLFSKGLACNFIKKETLALVFSCEFCEISKNTFF